MRIKVTVDCIEANKPTANNRIYSEASMLKMVEDANKKIESGGLFVTDEITPNVNLDGVFGVVKKCQYDKESGKIMIEVTEMDKLKRMGGLIKLLESKHFRVTPNVRGAIDSEGNVTVDETIAFVVTPTGE